MAESTTMRNNALPYPVYGVPWVQVVPILDADGDPVVGATSLDSEISLNGDTIADGGTEAEVGGGLYSIALTGANLTADIISGVLKSVEGKTTCFVLYPRKLVSLRSGTSQGGAAGYITLDASAGATNDIWNGCLCVATIDGNVEARIITDYTGSNQQAAVTPNWNVTPDSDDTFVIYLPEGMQMPNANVIAVAGTAQTARDLGASVLVGDKTGFTAAPTAGSIVTASFGTCVTPETTKTALLPAVAAGAKSGLPILDASTGLIIVGYGGGGVTVGTVTTVTNQLTESVIAAGFLDLANGIETGITLRQALRAISAMLPGIVSGGGTGTNTFKAIGAASDGTTRVTVTADASGNRSAVTLNL